MHLGPALKASSSPATTTRRRRPRYRGKNPRRFEEKYKEHDPARYSDTVAKVLAAGKTPVGTHRPVMISEILEVLAPKAGEVAADCTLGYGGHAQEILPRLQPGGRLLGLDVDPIELPKAETRLRTLGFGPDVFTTHRSNFAGLPRVLVTIARGHEHHEQLDSTPNAPSTAASVDIILADLGVSSMQLDDPVRGFSVKHEGPLDMRMNPQRGQPASALLEKIRPEVLGSLLVENADEPNAVRLAAAIAGRTFTTTKSLSAAIQAALSGLNKEDCDLSIRRVFQALRIAVNDEFSALETFLRNLPACLNPGGRVAILTFHSGEDRRVKKYFKTGFRDGFYAEIAREVIRPSAAERYANPRSAPAKLRWARRPA